MVSLTGPKNKMREMEDLTASLREDVRSYIEFLRLEKDRKSSHNAKFVRLAYTS